MPSKSSSVPVGGNPPNSPLMTLLSEYLVTTVSPSAICSSITSRFPLACSSRKRRTSALFSSTDTEHRPPRLKPTLRRKAHQSQTMVHPALHSGTLGRSIKPRYHDFHVPARGDK